MSLEFNTIFDTYQFFSSLFDIYPDKVHKGAVVGYRKADGTPLEFPCALDTRNAVKDAKGRWIASSLGLKPVVVRYSDSLRRTKAREAWIGNGFGKNPDYRLVIENLTLEHVRFIDDVTEIGMYAFDNCQLMSSITIPEGVTKIGDVAFRGCVSLTDITIPDSVTYIGEDAFRVCENLSSITIPEGVTSIEIFAFSGCHKLTSVTIPSSVTEIRGVAFYDCPALMSITVPAGVTEVGFGAFLDCPNLTDIYVDQLESNLLDKADLPAGCTIHWNQAEAV